MHDNARIDSLKTAYRMSLQGEPNPEQITPEGEARLAAIADLIAQIAFLHDDDTLHNAWQPMAQMHWSRHDRKLAARTARQRHT